MFFFLSKNSTGSQSNDGGVIYTNVYIYIIISKQVYIYMLCMYIK